MLAFLLLHANGVVRRERLIDALWGEQPPARAGNALQVAVHGLRRLLEPERIETVGDGYRLNVEPGELDLARFHELLQQSPAAALELWRGPALAGVDAPFAAAESSRLEELRLALTGAGGTGKTRLALEAAWQLSEDFDETVFVDLSPLSDPELVVATIAEALEVQPALEEVQGAEDGVCSCSTTSSASATPRPSSATCLQPRPA